jgi:hypothetical protein
MIVVLLLLTPVSQDERKTPYAQKASDHRLKPDRNRRNQMVIVSWT